jgi:hypothetical protein
MKLPRDLSGVERPLRLHPLDVRAEAVQLFVD